MRVHRCVLIERSRTSRRAPSCKAGRSRAGRSAREPLFVEPAVQRRQVRRCCKAQRPRERPTPLREVEATTVAVQVCTPPGQPAADVGDNLTCSPGAFRLGSKLGGVNDCHDTKQVGLVRTRSATHAGTRDSPTCHTQVHQTVYRVYLPTAESGVTARSPESGRMSIRHPVSRAANRAFCPSLPIASDSW